MPSPALAAVTAQVPPALVTDSVEPATAQPVDAPASNVSAPAPLPPLAVRVAVVGYPRLLGAAMVNTACAAFAAVTETGADVAAV